MGMTQGNFVEAALGATETTETLIGTINVPAAGISRIVGVYGDVSGVTTTAEQIIGSYRLGFQTLAGTFKFPASSFQAPAGTLTSPGFQYEQKIIPVNIPIPANETISCYATLNAVATGACRAMVGMIFE